MSEINHFVELSKINVNDKLEKKGQLTYLSWPYAVAELFKADPQANWVFHEPTMFGETMMVSCTVTAFNKPIMMHLPVMDYKNNAIANPKAFDVNKNMMRCLVKAIACHGLGLYVYAGEDLPNEKEDTPKSSKKEYPEASISIGQADWDNFNSEKQYDLRMKADCVAGAFDTSPDDGLIQFDAYKAQMLHEEAVALWYILRSDVKSALNKMMKKNKSQQQKGE